MTTPHERDRSLEQWLSTSLPVEGQTTDACLDAETAAAWVDGGSSASARQLAETHLSTCARCQALVASIVTLETAGLPAAVPVPSPWRAWRDWLVPLGAVAAAGLALAVWLNVPPQTVQQPGVPQQSRLEPVPDTSSKAGSATPAAAPAPSAGRADQAGASPQPAPAAPPAPAVRASPGRTANANRPLAKAGALAPPSAAPVDAGRRGRAAERGVQPTAAADAAAPLSAQQGNVSNQAFAAPEASGFEVTSADAEVRWRQAGSTILRSTDGGATWAPVVADAPGRLRAGAAPSAALCWLVGDAGLVLRAVDGGPFVRVAAPDASDLTLVTATSAANAVVGTADGRRFVTSDGGATWEPAR